MREREKLTHSTGCHGCNIEETLRSRRSDTRIFSTSVVSNALESSLSAVITLLFPLIESSWVSKFYF